MQVGKEHDTSPRTPAPQPKGLEPSGLWVMALGGVLVAVAMSGYLIR